MADARPEPYFLLYDRYAAPSMNPGSTSGPYPTNMTFQVGYSLLRGPAGNTPPWLGDIRATTSTGENVPIGVRLDSSSEHGESYLVTPQSPWPAGATIELRDRFVAVPCGDDANPCVEGESPPFARLDIGAGPDVAKPRWSSLAVTYDAWRPYGGVESCMNTLCAGYSITAHFVPATDSDTPDEGVLYRIYPPGGNAYRIFNWGASIECTQCFHLPGMPGPPATPPAPVVIAAVDWLGHESDERIIVDFPPPPACDELLALLDAGPSDAPLPDARPPDAPLALPDAPGSSPTGSVACGCAAAGPAGGLGPALLVAAFLVRRRPSAGDAKKKAPGR